MTSESTLDEMLIVSKYYPDEQIRLKVYKTMIKVGEKIIENYEIQGHYWKLEGMQDDVNLPKVLIIKSKKSLEYLTIQVGKKFL